MTDIIIKGQSLSKTYQTAVDKVSVFLNLDVEIEKGKAIAIIGQSGRGKTTLLNVLSGLDRPTAGSVMFNEKRIDNLGEKELSAFRNENVGFIFQHHYLLENFTAIDNILIPLRIGGIKIDHTMHEKALSMIDMIGLKDRHHHFPDQLSGGERQRVAIIRALMRDPLVVFADEPTGSLDKNNSANVEEMIWHLKEQFGKTFIIATHNMEIAKKCDRIIDLG